MQCNFGSTTPDKASAPPPPPPREGITLTCNPPHPVGKGTVTLDSMMMEGKEKEEDGYSPSPTTSSSSPYIDAQIFSYAPDPSPLLPTAVSATPTRRASLVKVAALALGADGGCATGACSPPESEYCPPGYPGHPPSKANGTQRIIDYLNEVSTADLQWPLIQCVHLLSILYILITYTKYDVVMYRLITLMLGRRIRRRSGSVAGERLWTSGDGRLCVLPRSRAG